MILVPFGHSFWGLLVSFGSLLAPLGSFLAPWGPKLEYLPLGGELGANSWSQSDLIEGPIFGFVCKKSVLGRLFRRSFFWLVLLSFFGCPGVPRNHENQAKLCSVARKQGWAKIENAASRIDLSFILALIFMPWAVIFQIFLVFLPCVFQSIFATP